VCGKTGRQAEILGWSILHRREIESLLAFGGWQLNHVFWACVLYQVCQLLERDKRMPEYGESLVRAASQKGCQFILSKLNITTQNANALAVLGYAAAAIMCEKLP